MAFFFLSVIFNGHHSGNACDLINKGRKKKRKEKETEIMRGKRGEKVQTREKKKNKDGRKLHPSAALQGLIDSRDCEQGTTALSTHDPCG